MSTFAAFVFSNDPDRPSRGVEHLSMDVLGTEGVLIEVEWSSVNFKDGLASTLSGKVARLSPLIPGVDLAGRVLEAAPGFAVGDSVIAHGYDIGTARHGGYARYARVPAEWLVPLPAGLTTREAMVIGTGGFTAALSVLALKKWGIEPGNGPVLVTGATGGVGSMAVSMLAGAGFEVTASSGKPEAADFLRSLGATHVIDRSVLADDDARPLQTMEFNGAVDCVGGTTLANVLKRLKYSTAVAASGLTGGSALVSTVMPFILRGVALLGIDSVQTPMAIRVETWSHLARDLKPAGLDSIGHDITLDDLDRVLSTILAGQVTGRYVVAPVSVSPSDQ